MALKTFINGNSVNLTPVGKPPVTFVNGTKKVLTKGVTFINGEKVVLWDTNRLKISFIDLASVNGAETFYPVGFFANKDRVVYSSKNDVVRLNTSNLGNVTVDTTVNMGYVLGFSSVDSTNSNAIYYSCVRSSSNWTFNQLNINTGTGEIIASNSQSYNIAQYINNRGLTTIAYLGGWLNANGLNNNNRYVYVMDGVTVAYSYQGYPTGSGISISGGIPICFTKIDSTTAVGSVNIYNGAVGIAEYTATGYTVKSGTLNFVDFLTDGNTVAAAGESGFGLYTRNTSGNYVQDSLVASLSDHVERLIGKCRGKYYTVAVPTTAGTSGDYKLRIFNNSGVLVETIQLNDLTSYDPYSSNTFIPQLSQTGYLVCGFNTGKLMLIQCY